MAHLNVEIKARCEEPERLRQILADRGADFRGVDRQIDTYFNCPSGRLKLREGNIEHALIHYERPDQAGPKKAVVSLYHPPRDPALKAALTAALGVRVVVAKTREIYFIDNVKFHIDDVDDLGSFVEIEAIGKTGDIGPEKLRAQCDEYIALFGIPPEDLLTHSYGDMLTKNGPAPS